MTPCQLFIENLTDLSVTVTHPTPQPLAAAPLHQGRLGEGLLSERKL